MIHPVAVTIVANNYVPLARTLCHSFLEHHPNGRFFVLIVDEPTPELDLSNEPYEIVRLADLALPNNEMFVYQYSILELSTAVKPFLLRHLLDKYQLETLLYLDPDILITAPLTSIFKSFSNSSVLLIPHMFESPPDDGKKPSETDIMHSGAYNLGFLGIRNDATVSRLLEWWSERLADKCVVDLANARFVDQRWMDLAPSYFEDVEILRDIAINVAYWNLHERKLTQKDGQYFINNVPLAFFHFSGFNPLKPDQLSKHQTRHVIADHPALEALTQDYADRLMRHGYEELTQLRNAYLTLTNGVKLGRITQYLTLKAIERGLMVPSPQKDPDAYCRFMMTPNWVLDRRGLAPLLFALSHLRTDVAAAFPQAFDSNGNLEGLLAWVKNTGGQEEDLTEIFNGFGKFLYHSGATQKALKCWRKREDLRKAYPYAFTTIEGSQEYSEWIKHFGTVEEGFGKDDGMLFLQSRKGALKVLMLYFQDPIVQKEFPFLFLDAQRTRYVSWCYYEVCYRDMVSPEDVAWFDGFAESNKEVLMALTFGHSAWLHASLVGGGTVFNLNHLKDMLIANKVNFSDQDLVRLYASNLGISLLTQAEQFYLHSQDLRDKFPKAFESADNLEPLVKHLSLSFPDAASVAPPSLIWLKYSNRIRWALRKMGMKRVRKPVPLFKVIQNTQQLEAGSKKGLTERMQREYQEFRQSKPGVNLLGYFHSTTGMGESVRSMARTLAGGGVPFRRVPLSFYHLRPEL
ncbi:MAG: hypothetical protein OEW39_04040, partial [Deltaproteobacteria bacterium]|nr:hypothetical protein [Deltaproteobacteria bacterium]